MVQMLQLSMLSVYREFLSKPTVIDLMLVAVVAVTTGAVPYFNPL
jgi:hypothetical protein